MINKIQKLKELSKELETKILASVISSYDETRAAEILTVLRAEDFEYHQAVFNLLKQAVETKNNLATMMIDRNITVSNFLMQEYGSLRETQVAMDELRRVSLTLDFIKKTLHSVENAGYKNIEENIAAHISDLSSLSILRGDTLYARDGVGDFQSSQAEISERMSHGDTIVGIPTGFDIFDTMTEGILKNSLFVVGGYSGAGKTTLAINFIANILAQKKKVVMFSLEMGAVEIFTKLIALLAEMNPMKALKGRLTDDELARLEEAKARVYESRFSIYDNTRSLGKLKMAMLKEALVDKPDLFVIDYMQMISEPKLKTMVERMSVIPNELKDIAKSTGVPILAISSISNADARTKNDEVGGYKGSGDIEFAADLAVKLINADDRDTRDQMKFAQKPVYVDVIITKQRHGMTGKVEMSFYSYIGKFKEGRDART